MKERRKILEFAHDNKTLARIKEKFYWPGVRGDTWSYIAGCSICNKRKPSKPLSVFDSTKKRQLMKRLAHSVIPIKILKTTAYCSCQEDD